MDLVKNKLALYAVHFVKKSNALVAACGQDVPRRQTLKRAKVTCKACLRSRAFRGNPS